MREKIKRADIWQFLRFCLVGTLNTSIDFGVLNLLLWLYPTADTGKILEYNSVTVLLACTNSFFWNKYWTFQKRGPITFQEVYRFIVVAGGTILINDILVWMLSRTFPGIMGSARIGANVLKLGSIAGTMSISFFGMRLWVFFQNRFAAEVRSLADHETKKLPALTLMFDVDTVIMGAIKPVPDIDTVIIGAIKPVHDVDTIGIHAISKPKSNMLASDSLLNKYAHQQILREISYEDVNHT